jgi:poly[(R)-3-hydroxyalkanoate] polymerase subunit PhaC
MNLLESNWTLVFLVATGLSVWLGLVWLHLRFWERRIALPLHYDEEERIDTPDGAAVELRRIAPTNEAASDQPPILLVHGICANHRNQDIHPKYSLARHLAGLGRDVWLLTLRSGLSWGFWPIRRELGFANMARYDIPLGVSHVLERTGAKSLDFVAFSMGGMLLYASLGTTIKEESLRKAVFIGSPGRVDAPHPIVKVLRFYPRWLVPPILSGLGARMFAFLSEWFVTPLHKLIYNPRNFAKSIIRTALVNCIQDVPAALAADFLGWATRDGEIRLDGKRVLDQLAHVRIPALFVAGTVDHLGTESAVRAGFDAWGKEEPDTHKRFMLLGRSCGTQEDYGHGDLCMGCHADLELFEPVQKFLNELAPPTDTLPESA